ncbi:MAG: protein kinase [Alphaproteobacteria bacterium]|nr:protein kinase [Alphaproteobacteria bacterium]
MWLATLTDDEGFHKRVALKILREEHASPAAVARFRDEARITALIRDRAVVQVEPPVRIGDRWAIVMDLVEGESLAALFDRHGAFPVTVALEIASELARVLHALWTKPGPTGEPLHLLHRDLKPDNVHLTSLGEVRLLDFGIAKANVEREADSRMDAAAGTLGYVAPERFDGLENEVTDVYSLGVMIEQLLLGRRMMSHAERPTFQPGSIKRQAMDLCAQMRSANPTDRPRPRDVERRCRELLQGAIPRVHLRDWAESHVQTPQLDTGTIVEELVDQQRLTTAPLEPRVVLAGSTGCAVMASVAAGTALAAVALTVVATVWPTPTELTGPVEAPVPAVISAPPPAPVAPEPDGPPDIPPVPEPPPEPPPVSGPPAVAPVPAPSAGPVPEPPPVPEVPAPAEPPTVPPEPLEPAAVAPEPAATLTPVPPAPEPPADLEPASFAGRWTGTMGRRTLALDLRVQGGSITGTLFTQLGPTNENDTVRGAVQPVVGEVMPLDVEGSLYRLVGELRPRGGSGTVLVRGRPRGTWELHR